MNKKGEMEEVVKIIAWVVFLGLAMLGIYFLTRRFIS